MQKIKKKKIDFKSKISFSLEENKWGLFEIYKFN